MRRPLPRYVALALTVALGASCSDSENNASLAPEGAACMVDRDCAEGLRCPAMVCVPSTATDAGPDDAPDTGPGDDTGPTPGDGPYVVSFLVAIGAGSEANQRFLHALRTDRAVEDWEAVRLGSANESSAQKEFARASRVSADADDCAFGCWLSEDARQFVYVGPNGQGAFDVFAAPVDAELKKSGQPSPIVRGVLRPRVRGNHLMYVEVENGAEIGHALSLADLSSISTIGPLRAPLTGQTSSDTFFVEDDKAIVFQPLSLKLSVRIAPAGSQVEDDAQVYLLDGTNNSDSAGAIFGSTVPADLSDDGTYLAFKGTLPNDYAFCGNSDSSSCDQAAGEHCGSLDRCTVRQQTVRIINLEAAAEIPNGDPEDGMKCDADEQCSAGHECDISSPDRIDEARCVPRRVVLGLPRTPLQPIQDASERREGCEISDGFTKIDGPLRFGTGGALYTAGARDCGTSVKSAALRIGVDGSVTEIAGNNGEAFDASRCLDASGDIALNDCPIQIAAVVPAPDQASVAMLATNPKLTQPTRALRSVDAYIVKTDGSGLTWIGRTSINDEVSQLATHRARE